MATTSTPEQNDPEIDNRDKYTPPPIVKETANGSVVAS